MVKEIDRKQQQILGGVLVKDLRSLVIARKEEELRGTKLFYSETAPGPITSRARKIEKTRMGLRVYGKGVNRNKLVVHTMYSPRNRSNPPKESVQKNFFGLYNWICKFNRPKKIGMLLLWFISTVVLHKKVDRDVNLTDVFGCLMALQPIEEITVQNIRVEKKRDLKLQNIRGEQVTITLWAESATSFQEDALQSLSPPVFIVLTSLKVKKYKGKPVLGSTGSTVCIFNPDIPQLSKYKQEFEYLKTSIEILQTSAEKYGKDTIMADSEQKTIEQLLLLDLALNKNTSFVCQATIVDYDLTRGWWYKSCPFKMNFIVEDATNQFNFLVIGRIAEKLLGISCHSLVIEEGYDDSFVLPPHLQKLVGSMKKFQVRFGNQNNEFANTDFVVHGIIEEEASVNPKLSSIVPRTPTTKTGKQVIDAATPIPVTTLESHIRQIKSIATNKGVKRTLFVEDEPSKARRLSFPFK
ncbi:unnamed protein product [Malus baccata var. baccata]